MSTKAYAVASAEALFGPLAIERRALGPEDVEIDILYCGVCHSDLHTARSEWPGTRYPCVPGHEIVGRVTAVGAKVTKFSVGDLAAVGCMVDSCRRCLSCDDGLEQYCEHGFTATYNGPIYGSGENTFGGYSEKIVVDAHFVLAIHHSETQLAGVAPLLCAGITTWSPLKHWGVGPGKSVGIVGIGGLGHMGVKLAHALGAHVVAFTTSPSKRDAALALGADEVVVSTDPAAMAARAGSLDFILDTVAVAHDLDAYVNLLKRDGALVLVGVPATPHPSPSAGGLIFKRRQVAGSLIGGVKETQEMLDFCAERGIVADIETIAMQQIETAYARMLKNDVKYRFVIDMATLKAA
ncbi:MULTISPECIES: NAD(P)-dependent alcohol dehydrogenase [Methylosinus]|uniref:NAD(P)-dependent alcohol dehydrogenase n=1 Tax=Methylosinus trichosporium (strain ATCC 35070 / NCIMB 11131 / UNIQEM 75 / OB3b) TaxID=595536 RepID=A0A2D2D4Z0_METT3|nr:MULTISPECIES: NAD(P)-dependent alcohol dehydrogenase [Methylosinus]ATQ70101.1 NAD(P)-dependent alcohol dehydrogenase [Methylosinus trichosporium OB3b]OBS52539.1 hydroxyacid dehydrogenase [Methylosinus sp. 3S-1]